MEHPEPGLADALEHERERKVPEEARRPERTGWNGQGMLIAMAIAAIGAIAIAVAVMVR